MHQTFAQGYFEQYDHLTGNYTYRNKANGKTFTCKALNIEAARVKRDELEQSTRQCLTISEGDEGGFAEQSL